MYQHSNEQAMINRGRKAGLSTREIYLAMATRPAGSESVTGRADSNGYVCAVAQQGRRLYRPAAPARP
jgi:hypothetical protein